MDMARNEPDYKIVNMSIRNLVNTTKKYNQHFPLVQKHQAFQYK